VFARVSTFRGSTNMDEVSRQARETVLPAARELSGFGGLLALGNRETGDVLAATLWETEQAMKDSEEAANRLRAQAAEASGGQQPVGVDRYEVLIDERA
jgi:heme-degrading monooxygenase HmoA